MTRAQRKGHFLVWLVLAPTLVVAAIALLLAAPAPLAPPADQSPGSATP